tara:strand:- start:815 stop:1321 length:507 start_codon:yes stop_codon:yes gene_type:complete
MEKQNFMICIGLLLLYLVYSNTKSRYKPRKEIIQINTIIEDNEPEFKEPRKYYDSRYYPRKRMDINIPTRGEPPDYQQIGLLTGEGTENIKPLYGRQTYRGSNQWNYFTSLDSHLATKIPVYMNGQDCTDERGCKELNKGQTVNMGEDGTNYSASIFNNKTIRYIPYL